MATAMLMFIITKSLLILAVVSLFNMVGVELNQGQATCGTHRELNQINFGLINARSAVNTATIIHNIINDNCIDILAITETCCLLLQCAVLNVRSTSSSLTGLLDLSRRRSSLNFLIYWFIYSDFNCPGSDSEMLDDRLDVLLTYNLK